MLMRPSRRGRDFLPSAVWGQQAVDDGEQRPCAERRSDRDGPLEGAGEGARAVAVPLASRYVTRRAAVYLGGRNLETLPWLYLKACRRVTSRSSQRYSARMRGHKDLAIEDGCGRAPRAGASCYCGSARRG